MTQTIGDFFDNLCIKHKTNKCIYFPKTEVTYTYESFHEYCMGFAKSLIALGLKKGDYIAIKSANTPEWIALQMATSKLGIVLVCLNPSLTVKELDYTMEHSESKLLFSDDGLCGFEGFAFPNELEAFLTLGEAIEAQAISEMQLQTKIEDPINIQYTSGTTNSPKAVISTHKTIVENILEFDKRLDFTSKDNLLLCLPLAHVMGCILSLFPMFFVGASVTVVEKFRTDKVLQVLKQEECTILNAVPTMYLYLLERHASYNITSLRSGMIAGSIAKPALLGRIVNELGMAGVFQVFGQTECLAATQMSWDDSMEKRLTTVGRPLADITAKIIDIQTQKELGTDQEGELLLHTPYCMQGYLKNPEATEATIDKDGWLHTGDLATIDEEGYIQIKARIKDVVIRGGENICPTEIEEALTLYPGIQEAAVIGVDDHFMCEELCAFIVAEEEINKEEVKSFLATLISKHKVPHYIHLIEALPKTGSGKVKKFELKLHYETNLRKAGKAI